MLSSSSCFSAPSQVTLRSLGIRHSLVLALTDPSKGWTPKAIGALAGTILTTLIGFATVIWYGWAGLDEGELEEEVKRKIATKQTRGSLLTRLTRRD